MNEKYSKIKQLKIALQTVTATKRKLDKIGIIHGYSTISTLHMEPKYFFKVANALKIDPIIEEEKYSKYFAYFFYEGCEIVCFYSERQEFGYFDKKLNDRFKELFFETEDKQSAFTKLRQEKIDSTNPNYIRQSPIYWMKAYNDFEHYLRRKSSKQESYESRLSKYLNYKNKFEPLDDDIYYNDAKRHRPNEDFFIPLSFKQWNKANY